MLASHNAAQVVFNILGDIVDDLPDRLSLVGLVRKSAASLIFDALTVMSLAVLNALHHKPWLVPFV
jgi:hypothetical protein